MASSFCWCSVYKYNILTWYSCVPNTQQSIFSSFQIFQLKRMLETRMFQESPGTSKIHEASTYLFIPVSAPTSTGTPKGRELQPTAKRLWAPTSRFLKVQELTIRWSLDSKQNKRGFDMNQRFALRLWCYVLIANMRLKIQIRFSKS